MLTLASEPCFAGENDPLSLSYQSPVGCGTREQVLTRLQSLRGSAEPPANRVEATVVVKRTAHGYDVSFRAHDAHVKSQRQLVVADCAAAVEASALLLHLTLDPELARATGSENTTPAAKPAASGVATVLAEPQTNTTQVNQPERSEREATAQPQGPPQTVEPPLPTASRAKAAAASELSDQGLQPSRSSLFAPDGLRPWLGVGGSVVNGVAPHWSAGVALEGGISLGGWSVQLQAAHHSVPSVPVIALPGARVHTSLTRVHAYAGPEWGNPSVHGGPVAALGLEHLNASARGISNPDSGATTWWSAGLGANLQLQLYAGLGLDLRALALVSLERPTFSVEGIPGSVHQPSRLGWCGSLGVVWMWNTAP